MSMAALPRQNEQDLASLFMKIKERVKPIQNAHILIPPTAGLRFQIGLRLDAYINLIRLDM